VEMSLVKSQDAQKRQLPYGEPTFLMVFATSLCPGIAAGCVTLTRRSDSQATTTLGTTTRQDLTTVGGGHAGAETVVALTLEVAGLVGALGRHGEACLLYFNGTAHSMDRNSKLQAQGALGHSAKFSTAFCRQRLVAFAGSDTLLIPNFIHSGPARAATASLLLDRS
jgi:hypothetical protein